MQKISDMQRRFIAGLDVGTTTVRCQIYDFNFNTKGKAQDKVLERFSDQRGRFHQFFFCIF